MLTARAITNSEGFLVETGGEIYSPISSKDLYAEKIKSHEKKKVIEQFTMPLGQINSKKNTVDLLVNVLLNRYRVPKHEMATVTLHGYMAKIVVGDFVARSTKHQYIVERVKK